MIGFDPLLKVHSETLAHQTQYRLSMLGTVGDLVEDIVVRFGGTVNIDSDTEAIVTRRRGGSSANMAACVVRCGHAARFIGQVGDDAHGAALVASLESAGVDVVVRRQGRTGTIVVLVDHHGQRTMLSDRGDSSGLDRPDPSWLDGLSALHVPLYSLVVGSLASTSATLIRWAHDRHILVSIDASSVAIIEHFGVTRSIEMLQHLRPSVLLCNESEAACLGIGMTAGGDQSIASQLTVVKRGPDPASVMQPGRPAVQVAALGISHVRDTTGAGDAFAAGLLCGLVAGESPLEATQDGHRSAATTIAEISLSHPSDTL